METVTVENRRIRVTVTGTIAADYHTMSTGQYETQEQAFRGRLLAAAMDKLASATELALSEGKLPAPDEVLKHAHAFLMHGYLICIGRADPSDVLRRHSTKRIDGIEMERDALEAVMYADEQLREITADEVALYIDDRVSAGGLIRQAAAERRAEISSHWSAKVGEHVAAALEHAYEHLDLAHYLHQSYHQKRASGRGWKIEVLGRLPSRVGKYRLKAENCNLYWL